MKTIKTSVLTCAVALATSMTFAHLGGAAETLIVATEGAFPPFNMVDANGTPQGFDVDITHALCDEMNVTCKIVLQDFNGTIPALLAGKFDIAVSSLSITPEREKSVAFTDPYYSNKLQFAGPKGKDFTVTVKGLKDMSVGVERSTISASWMEDNMPDVDIKQYDTQEECFLDLAAGRIDLTLNDVNVTYHWLETAGSQFEFKGKPVYDDDKIAIALKKGRDSLRERLNKAIAAIRANGTYAKINAKYFPYDIY